MLPGILPAMTRLGWITTSIAVILCASIILLITVWTSHRSDTISEVSTASSTLPLVDPSTLSIYSSGTYGFSFFYPRLATVADQFSTTSASGLLWRENPIATGTLIARIGVEGGEARIGMSRATKEIAACVKTGPAEQARADTILGSTTWKTFSFDKLGTDAEQHVMSYRTVHDNACFALETFASKEKLATTTQDALDSIIQSFTFAKP